MKLVVDLADLKRSSILRRVSVPQRSSFIRSLAGCDGCLVQTSDGMYWRYGLNGEVRLRTRRRRTATQSAFRLMGPHRGDR
jgi:hypothetical protein